MLKLDTLISDVEFARQQVCEALNDLDLALKPMEEKFPIAFWKPLAEMGASDRLRVSDAILKMVEEVKKG